MTSSLSTSFSNYPSYATIKDDKPLLSDESGDEANSERELEQGKSIGYFGGVSLLVNSMTGPALVGIPLVIAQAGWITTSILVVIMWVISTFSGWALCEAMARVPGNEKFQGRVELTTLVRHHFGNVPYFIILMVLNVCLLSLNVASIIATAQAIDSAILEGAKKNCGLELFPHAGWKCVNISENSGEITPFGSDLFIFSPGMMIVLIAVVPLGYVNLTSNIIVQEGAFVSILAMLLLFTIDFIRMGFHGNIHPVAKNQKDVLGTVMFNFVVAVAIPSWINEKKYTVNPRTVVTTSTGIASMVFLYVGILSAATFSFVSDTDLLSMLSVCDHCFILTRLTAYYLPIAVFLTSIPVYSIIVKYNLIHNHICGNVIAFLASVILPWLIALIFYSGSGLLLVINWASLYLQSTINFILPMILYIKSRRKIVKRIYDDPENTGSIDFNSKIKPFRALPSKFNGNIVAMVIIALIVVGVIAVTIINIV